MCVYNKDIQIYIPYAEKKEEYKVYDASRTDTLLADKVNVSDIINATESVKEDSLSSDGKVLSAGTVDANYMRKNALVLLSDGNFSGSDDAEYLVRDVNVSVRDRYVLFSVRVGAREFVWSGIFDSSAVALADPGEDPGEREIEARAEKKGGEEGFGIYVEKRPGQEDPEILVDYVVIY